MSRSTHNTGPRFDVHHDAAAQCPNCEHQGLTIFYEVHGIPCHSMILLDSAKEASDYHTGDLRLGFCESCGFITNTRYDIANSEYSQKFEESQGFSATFNKFARELAKRYADRYDLAGDKVALEIGCGKGEWLCALCEESGGRGIGIDPGYTPSRLTSPAADRIEWIIDFYGPKFAHLQADFIACRHTLEHIQPTLEFMRSIRATIGDRKDTILFFELPEVLRELEEGAFWDMYYEHCTYFSPGSLARLFRKAGFDVTYLSVEYASQYIILDAVPSDTETKARLPLEDDMARLRAGVKTFGETASRVARYWSDSIRAAHARGEKTVVWGSGSKGVSFLTTLGLRDEVSCVVDINTFRQGKFMAGSGHEIVGPEALTRVRPDHIVIMNPIYVPEISEQVRSMGLSPKIVAV
ncbi:MAG: class I SAM-dependent methyltransferase [Phycisphaerales bacterium]